MPPDTRRLIDDAAALIEQADALIVAAGAGMGVDSGLPDFRGTEGFWKAYPALGKARMEFHRIASPEAFRRHPERAWGFYGHRLQLYRNTVPHAGFGLLRQWIGKALQGGAVFTSNVDGHFHAAGFDPNLIEECHGSIHHLQCLASCHERIWSAEAFDPVVNEQECLLLNSAPRCPSCGDLARPNVMMFSDLEWLERRQRDQAARLERWLADLGRPVVIEIGAGTAIPSVRHFSQRVIYEFGGRLIRINPRESEAPTSRDVGLAMGAMEALEAIAVVLGDDWGGQLPLRA